MRELSTRDESRSELLDLCGECRQALDNELIHALLRRRGGNSGERQAEVRRRNMQTKQSKRRFENRGPRIQVGGLDLQESVPAPDLLVVTNLGVIVRNRSGACDFPGFLEGSEATRQDLSTQHLDFLLRARSWVRGVELWEQDSIILRKDVEFLPFRKSETSDTHCLHDPVFGPRQEHSEKQKKSWKQCKCRTHPKYRSCLRTRTMLNSFGRWNAFGRTHRM